MRIHFTFDDTQTSDIWAAEELAKRNLQGIFFLCENKKRVPNLEAHAKRLIELGQIVGNHTPNHTSFGTHENVDELIEKEIIPFNEMLKSWGATGEYFAYPQSSGTYNNIFLHQTFTKIYRGYDEDVPDQNGEISRVSVFDWPTQKIKPMELIESYQNPLQLHAIGTGGLYDLTQEQFLHLLDFEVEKHG